MALVHNVLAQVVQVRQAKEQGREQHRRGHAVPLHKHTHASGSIITIYSDQPSCDA